MCCANLCTPSHPLQVSYTASGRQFEDREKFPRLYRLQPLVISYNEAYVRLITDNRWQRVAVIYEVNPLFSKVHLVSGGGLESACVVWKTWSHAGVCSVRDHAG